MAILRCPSCNSENTISIGYRHNNSGKKRIRRCTDCLRKFTPNNNFPRARHKKNHLIEAVALYCGGFSLNDVKNHMLQHRSINISRTSILKWSKKYSNLVDDFAFKLKYVIRGVDHCEDIYLEIEGNRIFYSGVIDSKVIFKISSRLAQPNPKGT
jgi:transposase-like protein